MLNIYCPGKDLRSQFLSKLRNRLYNRDDFTQGEYIDELDDVRNYFEQDPNVDKIELDEIVKSLINDWKNIGENIRVDNQQVRTTNVILAVAGVTAVITGIVTWMLMRNKD